jgi:hypothetical protein
VDDREGFAEWRGGVESRVSTLEATVEREAWARARMDKDMSDLKLKFDAQDRMLKALGKTQSEHTAMLRDHTAMLKDHTARLLRLEAGVDELRAGMGTVQVGVQTIIGLLDRGGGDGGTEQESS